jgi:hypothetical protein
VVGERMRTDMTQFKNAAAEQIRTGGTSGPGPRRCSAPRGDRRFDCACAQRLPRSRRRARRVGTSNSITPSVVHAFS